MPPVGLGEATLEDGQWPHSFCSCWRSPAEVWWPTWSGRIPPPARSRSLTTRSPATGRAGCWRSRPGSAVSWPCCWVASVHSTKRRRAGRKQLRGLRRGLEDQVAAPEPDHGHLLDGFFGPEEPSRHLGGPASPADPRGQGPQSRAEDPQGWVTPQPIQHPTEPLYQQVRSAHLREVGWED